MIVKKMTPEEIEETRLGYPPYFPAMLDGRDWAFFASAAVLLLWHALVRYNESTEKFTLLQPFARE